MGRFSKRIQVMPIFLKAPFLVLNVSNGFICKMTIYPDTTLFAAEARVGILTCEVLSTGVASGLLVSMLGKLFCLA